MASELAGKTDVASLTKEHSGAAAPNNGGTVAQTDCTEEPQKPRKRVRMDEKGYKRWAKAPGLQGPGCRK